MNHVELDRRISKILNLEPGSIFILTPNKHCSSLHFAYPNRLNGNSVPVDNSSISGRAVIARRPYILNNVQGERGVNFLNCLTLRKGTPPIQRVIAYPVLFADGVIAVLQVTRKGDALSEAKNFYMEDVEKIQLVLDDVLSIRLAVSA